MTRCALCRATTELEPTTLPGGWRCTDHTACRERVREIVAAWRGLEEVCGG